jgi:predicted SAM-dependent methyltransferase
MEELVKVDLACGDNKREGFIGVDFVETSSTDVVFDLQTYPWPFEDNSVDEINCSHYVEHIPHNIMNPNDRRDGWIQFMDEVYRILKPGGKATITTPYYTSIRADQDPTHCRSISEASYYYVNKEWRDNNKLSHYGIKCDFDVRFSFYVTNELILKSEEIRNRAFKYDWNTADDIIAEMTKRT